MCGASQRRAGARQQRAQLGAAESSPPAAGGALATAMLVGRMLLLDNSNDRAQMLDVGNVIMIMHG